MTGLEDSVKGKVFYKTESGQYKELGILKSTEIENTTEITNIKVDTKAELECTINDKDTIRKLKQLKQLFKTDKEKKAERRFNKNSFRNFIRNI